MPDLRTIVQRMVDAGEDEEAIGAVIGKYNELNPPAPPVAPPVEAAAPTTSAKPAPTPIGTVSEDEPGDFWGGFRKSLFSGEALKAGLQGAGGFLRGAVADIPSTLIDMAKDAGEVITNPDILAQAPAAFKEGIPAVGRAIAETTSQAGSDPQSFGRMMGQLTGQPAIMAKAPGIAGRNIIAPAGKLLAEKQPLTGMLPHLIDVRTGRMIEGALGRGIQRTGEWMGGTLPAKETPSAVRGVGSDYGMIEGAAGELPGALRRHRSLSRPGGGIGVRARGGTPSRNQAMPYDPNPVQQEMEGLAGDYVAPNVEGGNILARPPQAQGTPSRMQSRPYEPSAPQAAPVEGGLAGEFDLTQPVEGTIPFAEPNVIPEIPPELLDAWNAGTLTPEQMNQLRAASRVYEGAPEGTPRFREPFTPSEAGPAEVPEAGNLVREKVPSIEDQFAQIIEDVRGETPDLRSTELPVDLSQPQVTFGKDVGPLQNRPEGARLVPGETAEQAMARAVNEAFAEAQAPVPEPGVELPPPPYSLGGEAAPTQPRVSFSNKVRPPKADKKPKPKPAPPPPETFEPSVRPKSNEGNLLEEITKNRDEMDQLHYKSQDMSGGPEYDAIQARIRELALRNRTIHSELDAIEATPKTPSEGITTAAGDVVDPNTGELLSGAAETPESIVGASDLPPDVQASLLERINQFFSESEGSKEIPNWAERVAERLSREKTDKGPSNRRMFERSGQLAAENKLASTAAESKRFADEVSPAGQEFSEDMLFTPEELAARPDIPEMISPVENQFDPRITPGGVVSEATPEQVELFRGEHPEHAWMRDIHGPEAGRSFTSDRERASNIYGGGDKGGGTLFSTKVNKTDLPNYTHLGGLENEYLLPADIAEAARTNVVRPPQGSSAAPVQETPAKPSLFDRAKNFLKDEEGSAEMPKSAEKIAEKISPSTPRPKPLQRLTVTDRNGKKLGNITVTHEQIRAIKTNAKFSDIPDEKVAEVIRTKRLKDILEEHDLTENQVNVQEFRPTSAEAAVEEPKPKLVTAGGKEVVKEAKPTPAAEAKAAKTKATEAKSKEMPPIPEEFVSAAPTTQGQQAQGGAAGHPAISVDKPKTKAKLDPDEAFGRHGDIKPVRDAYQELDNAGAPDTQFKDLLPKSMRYALEQGESFKARLKTLLEALRIRVVDLDAEAAHQAHLDDLRAKIASGEIDIEKPPPPKVEEPPLRAKEFGKERTEKPSGATRVPPRASRKWGGFGSAFKGNYPKFETQRQKELNDFFKRFDEKVVKERKSFFEK